MGSLRLEIEWPSYSELDIALLLICRRIRSAIYHNRVCEKDGIHNIQSFGHLHVCVCVVGRRVISCILILHQFSKMNSYLQLTASFWVFVATECTFQSHRYTYQSLDSFKVLNKSRIAKLPCSNCVKILSALLSLTEV